MSAVPVSRKEHRPELTEARCDGTVAGNAAMTRHVVDTAAGVGANRPRTCALNAACHGHRYRHTLGAPPSPVQQLRKPHEVREPRQLNALKRV